MNDNLKLWDSVKRVPPEHLKQFTRGGGFKGTAIKPMWSVHRMTEEYGPCGDWWGIDPPEFSVVPAGNEILVFCIVRVWYKKVEPNTLRVETCYLTGVGGDKILVQQSSGLRSDDEAYKKAYTDAIGNALKFLGVGADIHMGLWDGNKYADDEPPVMTAVVGTKGASKGTQRDAYSKLVNEIRNSESLATLSAWYQSNIIAIDAMPPDWVDELRIEYSDKARELKKELKV
jgi:hypothetical protein